MNDDFQCVCIDKETNRPLDLCGSELCAKARTRGYNNLYIEEDKEEDCKDSEE
jgi:hypothetical protein